MALAIVIAVIAVIAVAAANADATERYAVYPLAWANDTEELY